MDAVPTFTGVRRSSLAAPAFFSILILSLALRLLALDQQSIWFDEALTAQVAARPLSELVGFLQQFENTKPPLYYVIMHVWQCWGSGDFWLRLPSALFGAIACTLVAAVGCELLGERRGWWAGLVLAVSPLHLWYSQEARMYALLTALGAAATLFLLRFLRTQARGDLLGYAVFALLTCYTFTYGIFLLAFAVLYACFYRPASGWKVRRQVLGASVATFVGFMPWIWQIIAGVSAGHGFQVFKGSITQAVAYTFFSLGFGSSFGPTTEALRTHKMALFQAEPLAAAVLVAGLLLVLAVVATGLVRLWSSERPAFWFVVLGLVIFGGGPALVSLLQPKITDNPRYAILAALPFAVALLGAALPGPRWRLRCTILGVFAAGVACSLFNHFFTLSYWKEDLRGAARFATALTPLPQQLVLCPPYLSLALEYYAPELPPPRLLALGSADATEELAALQRELAGASSWLLLSGRRDYGDPQNRLPSWIAAHWTVLAREKLPGVEALVLAPKSTLGAPGFIP